MVEELTKEEEEAYIKYEKEAYERYEKEAYREYSKQLEYLEWLIEENEV